MSDEKKREDDTLTNVTDFTQELQVPSIANEDLDGNTVGEVDINKLYDEDKKKKSGTARDGVVSSNDKTDSTDIQKVDQVESPVEKTKRVVLDFANRIKSNIPTGWKRGSASEIKIEDGDETKEMSKSLFSKDALKNPEKRKKLLIGALIILAVWVLLDDGGNKDAEDSSDVDQETVDTNRMEVKKEKDGVAREKRENELNQKREMERLSKEKEEAVRLAKESEKADEFAKKKEKEEHDKKIKEQEEIVVLEKEELDKIAKEKEKELLAHAEMEKEKKAAEEKAEKERAIKEEMVKKEENKAKEEKVVEKEKPRVKVVDEQNDENAKSEKLEHIGSPNYEFIGRGLVYNCTGKHWACVDRESYFICRNNFRWARHNSKPPECVVGKVYATDEDCKIMQIHNINTMISTSFCKVK